MAPKANKKTDDNDEDDDDDLEEESSSQSRGKTFSQAEVNRIASQEKKEGRKAERKAILDALGTDDMEEAAEIIKRAKAKSDEDATEVERERAAAQREKDAAAKEKAEAAKERMKARLERKLLRSGVSDKKIDRALSLLGSDLDDDADDDAITSAVESLKEDLPEFFAVAKNDDSDDDDDDSNNRDDDEDGTRNGRRANPPKATRQPKQKGKGDSAEVAKSLLQQRHGDRLKRTGTEDN